MLTNIISLDLGRSSLGLAISRSGMFTQALPNLHFAPDNYDECLEKFLAVAKTERIEHIVMGYPLYPSGDECEMTPIVMAFAEKIKPHFPHIDIKFQDERNTTVEASEMLHLNKKNSKKQKQIIDSAAAVIILERYLRSINQY